MGTYTPSSITQIVFLGTGTPNPDPHHQGPCVALIVNEQSYLIDCGVGLVRQAALATERGARGLGMERLTRAFITHLHSDHTIGLPDLMLTPAVTGRIEPLEIYGPPGTSQMVDHLTRAFSEDRQIRFYEGEPSVQSGYEVKVTEIEEGPIYEDENVSVSAFNVHHGAWKHCVGFRFQTPDLCVVASGDTTFCPNLIEHARGCDVLIHEVYSEKGLQQRTPDWQAYHSSYHTSGPDLGRIAREVKPKAVFLYHVLTFGEPVEQVVDEVHSEFAGDVIEAQDIFIY